MEENKGYLASNRPVPAKQLINAQRGRDELTPVVECKWFVHVKIVCRLTNKSVDLNLSRMKEKQVKKAKSAR